MEARLELLQVGRIVVPLEPQRVERGGSLEGVAVRSAWVGRMSLW